MRKLAVWIVGMLAIASSAWAAGLVWFAMTIPRDVMDIETHTDAIVVLTGGSERIDTGLKLLAEGRAEQLYISGVGGPTKAPELVARTASDPQLGERVAIGNAINTPGNAAETAEWVHTHHISSIRLVTASYHMRRSLLELGAAMPEIKIIPHPVFPANVKSNDWWRWPGTASLIAREYTKFAITWAFQQIGLSNDVAMMRASALWQIAPAFAATESPTP